MIGLREDQQMKARIIDYLNYATGLCGRGLAPDSGTSVTDPVPDRLQSGASPLPHWTVVTVKPGGGFAASKAAG
jgi:hypothetical protein